LNQINHEMTIQKLLNNTLLTDQKQRQSINFIKHILYCVNQQNKSQNSPLKNWENCRNVNLWFK